MISIDNMALRKIAQIALEEDAPWGDVTTTLAFQVDREIFAEIVARESGVFSDGGVLEILCGFFPNLSLSLLISDGATFKKGDVLANISGSAHALLRVERVALNFLQRMCGIATYTRAFVDSVTGLPTRITDTRKTTPGLRILEKHAVVCGGGFSHRHSLSDAVLLKDNHLAVLTEQESLTSALRRIKNQLGHTLTLEVEVDSLSQFDEVLSAGVADVIMLDNFLLDDMNKAVKRAKHMQTNVCLEASGGITLDNVRDVAMTGVDVISVGALTYCAPAIDIALDVRDYEAK